MSDKISALSPPDVTKIFRLPKLSPRKPYGGGITEIRGKFHAIYYDQHGKTKTMPLRTDDPVEAQQCRDVIHRAAAALNRAPASKMEFYARSILRDPTTTHGMSVVVCFGRRTVRCRTWKEAVKERAKIARDIIKSEDDKRKRLRKPEDTK